MPSISTKVASLALLSGALLVLAQPAAQANLLLNGSFEQGPVGNPNGLTNNNLFGNLSGGGTGSWDTWDSILGWTSPTGVIEIQTVNTLNPSLGPQDGRYYVELDAHPQSNANSSMEQSFTGGGAAGTQTLSYYYRPRTGSSGDNGIRVYFNNVLIDPALTGNGAQPAGWTQLSSAVTVLAGINTVRFEAFGTANTLGGLVDNVVLTPVPAAALLFGSALAGLGWMRRRRQAGTPEALPA